MRGDLCSDIHPHLFTPGVDQRSINGARFSLSDRRIVDVGHWHHAVGCTCREGLVRLDNLFNRDILFNGLKPQV